MVGGWRSRSLARMSLCTSSWSDEAGCLTEPVCSALEGVSLVMDRPLSLPASGYAGTTLFLRLIVDFFIATGRCDPCNLWYKPGIKLARGQFDGLIERPTTSIADQVSIFVSSPQRCDSGIAVVTSGQ